MNKFCPNCGNKTDENAVVCIKCGSAIGNVQNVLKNKNTSAVASMVLGIISIITGVVASIFILAMCSESDSFSNLYEIIAVSLVFLIIPFTTSIIALIFGLNNQKKSSISLTGIITSAISLLMCIISIIFIICI